MTTKALSYTLTAEPRPADLQELNIFDSNFLLNYLEDIVAFLEGGSKSLASKSFRSARFSLINSLAEGRPSRVLSFEPSSTWSKDLEVYNRINVSILYADKFPESSLSEIIKEQNIDLVYLATINSSSLKVENHPTLIAQAHSHNIPVIYDNTAGALGTIFSPLKHEADFSIINANGSIFGESGIGAYITQGLYKKHSKDYLGIFADATLANLKKKRVQAKKQRFLISEDEQSFAKRLRAEVKNLQAFATNTFLLAKWLNQVEQVSEVNYPGLKNSDSYHNAETHLKAGYGSVLKFKVWDAGFSHQLLRSFFLAGKPAGLFIKTDNSAKEFTIEIKTDSVNQVLAYFQRVFSHLGKELEYRTFLKKQIRLEESFRELYANL